MNTATLPSRDENTTHWPDFYSILESSPDAETETLRRAINTLYVKATEQSDHRELNVRFYNQVLSQKVLPQCRLIFLNPAMKEAYDKQWRLHQEKNPSALSYQNFVNSVSKDTNSARTLLLSDDEIAILPSFGVEPAAPAISVLKPQSAPASVSQAAQIAPPEPIIPLAPTASKKGFPVGAAVAGVLVLAVVGAALNASKHSTSKSNATATPTAATVAVATPAAVVAPTSPPLAKLNTLVENADFESPTLNPWVSTSPQGYSGMPEDRKTYSGKNFLIFWGEKPFEATVSQTIKGLKPGKYMLRAWTRRGGGQSTAEMFAEGYGGLRKAVTMPVGWGYINTTIFEIDVKGNKCTIGFSIKSDADKTATIDAVEFFRK